MLGAPVCISAFTPLQLSLVHNMEACCLDNVAECMGWQGTGSAGQLKVDKSQLWIQRLSSNTDLLIEGTQ
jgi:hypothetical protein